MVTNRFIFVAIPHTGGGALHRWLHKIPGITLIDKKGHQPYDVSVKRCKDAGYLTPPTFGFIRNPWEWNVSVWCWVRAVNRRWFCGTFKDFIDLQVYSRHHDLPDLNTAGITAAWEYLQGDKLQYIGRFEHYEDELVRILTSIIPDLITEAQVRERISFVGLANYKNDPDGKPRREFQTYYTPEMRDTVANLEAGIIRRFGYSFEDPDRILQQTAEIAALQ